MKSRWQDTLNAEYEVWQLPAEDLGMAGLRYQRRFLNGCSVGLETWMAMDGDRGGFITLGLDGGYRFALSEGVSVDTGCFIGAGGGRGGYRLSGGGLMLRPHIALSAPLKDVGEIAAGVSYVVFPNGGTIESVQPFIHVALPFSYESRSSWQRRLGGGGNTVYGGGSWPNSLALITRYLVADDSSRTEAGAPQDDLALVGIECKSYLTDRVYFKLETEGAAQGDSSGYMQILAGSGLQIPVHEDWFAHTDFSVGGGGGGGVNTGGGLLLDAGLGISWYFNPKMFVGLSGGYMTAPDGMLDVWSGAVKIGYQAAHTPIKTTTVSKNGLQVERARLRLVHQEYMPASANWRRHHADLNVSNLGVQLDAFFNENWYVSGQGIAAQDGYAGAYMAGLVGCGVERDLTQRLFLSMEGLVGAAGGGGLDTGPGLVWQGNMGLGLKINDTFSVTASIGRMGAFEGPFLADVLGCSLNYNFVLFD